MANPYRSEAKSTGATKYKNITGKSGGGNPFDAGREDSDRLANSIKNAKQMPEVGDMKASGKKSGNRLDKYARGGRAKKGNNVTINIVSARPPSEPAPDIGAGGPLPPVGPPPGVGAAPVGPGSGPPPGPIGPPPPMMRKSGGRTNLENSKEDKMQDKKLAKKASGGKVTKKFYGGPAGLPPQAQATLPPQAMGGGIPAGVVTGPPAGRPMVPVMRAQGGSVNHKYPGMTHGSLSGLGRLDKKNKYGLKPNSKGD